MYAATKEFHPMTAPADMIVFDSSSRPSAQRSMIRKWADMVTMGHVTPALRVAENKFGIGHVSALLHSVRASGEAGITGAVLGAVSGAGGLDHDGIPVDLASGVVAIAGGVALAHNELGTTLRTVGHTSIGIFAFRKTEEWLGVRKATIHGEDWNNPGTVDTTGTTVGDEDPIIAAAKSL
jgi:hypothetical protein